MATRQQIAEYREAQQALTAVVEDELRTIWDSVRGLPLDDMRDVLVSEVPALIDRYGSVGQAVAAEWYEDLVKARAFIPDLYAPDAWASSTRWALSPLYQAGDDVSAFAHLVSAASRHVLNQGRHTISRSVARSPGVRYARVLGGSDPCAFCRVLASRGPVYGSRDSALLSDGEKYHDKCYCQPVPMRGEWVQDSNSERGETWEGDSIPGYDFDKMYSEDYLPHAGGSLSDVAAEMRKAVPGSR